jgi:hypothetical protein
MSAIRGQRKTGNPCPSCYPRFTRKTAQVELIAAFDDLVAKPRYFGEMLEWLKSRGVLAEQGQEYRKLYLQTLIRWLRHFLPGRYRLAEPGYSELFGRAGGWDGTDR